MTIMLIAYVSWSWWMLRRFGNKRTVAQNKYTFHDQVMSELKRFEDAIERGAKRRAEQARAADQSIVAANLVGRKSRAIPPAMVGSDRP